MQDGAVLAGATVQAKSVETDIVQKQHTNAEGFYAFLDLQPGHYDIEVTQSGFTTYRLTGILLDVNSAKVVNIKLKVGQVSEVVEVTAESSLLQAETSSLGQVVEVRKAALRTGSGAE